jgi:hypothetical protein
LKAVCRISSKLSLFSLTSYICFSSSHLFSDTQHNPAKPSLGINLAGPADWNTELPFVNVFYMSRNWISQQNGKSWGKGPAIELDEHGWVKRLTENSFAETLVCTINNGKYPSGIYTVLYDGEGELTFSNAATILSSKPGKIEINVDSTKGTIFLQLRKTNPTNYVRNIRIIMPGFIDTYQDNPWHPIFLNRWQGMKCLRYMDFMHTNGSKISKWSDRPTLSDATFNKKGIPLELMIDLANRLNADPWFCMPHLADDDYIRKFAEQVKSELDPNRKIYIEYSNEIWNGIFAQSRYAGEQGQKLKFAEKPWEAGWRYTAYRSVQIFKIWEDVFFGGNDRLVRVLPTQAANSYISERIVEFQDAYKHADALAIAPYISFNVHAEGKLNANDVATWSLNQTLDYMESQALPKSIEWINAQKKVVDKFGLKLITYEGGQHMVGVGSANRNEKLNELLQQANKHPRMGEIYQNYYQAWIDAGGDLFCHFSSIGRWGPFGSWGLMQYYNDDPAMYPKFTATMNWAKSLSQDVSMK